MHAHLSFTLPFAYVIFYKVSMKRNENKLANPFAWREVGRGEKKKMPASGICKPLSKAWETSDVVEYIGEGERERIYISSASDSLH